ncbi:pyridoxamine 5'-phosphate oxidase family protein [Lutibaculum baratangense]|uniref:Pyridoxamine 5'-phosphate oxidase-like protein n=1 Tax=Lutibaculum baratangense AMV1 TaxID=631454 RepID=V4RCJ0_9HYPH|nr:pyridoxamine 5'-phosphate oxidase family protein [Lutibaculum baratangense]ESR23114.1 pyridoxamine 5'-phosphate oxidase-like protein [Lutibaculum baratangense AMV1]
MTDKIDHVWEIMEKGHVCMLVTRDGGELRARPMGAMPRRDEHVVWFVTDIRAHKDEELRADPSACITFESGSTYLSVSGHAEVMRDEAKMKEIWSVAVDAWFPDGPEDPNAVLLKFTPHEAEYWEGPGRIVAGLKMAMASIRDTPPDLGENKKVSM